MSRRLVRQHPSGEPTTTTTHLHNDDVMDNTAAAVSTTMNTLPSEDPTKTTSPPPPAYTPSSKRKHQEDNEASTSAAPVQDEPMPQASSSSSSAPPPAETTTTPIKPTATTSIAPPHSPHKHHPAPELSVYSSGGIHLVKYSDKCIAVVGQTKEIKDDLKSLGGSFNKGLTVDGVKQAGWIFQSAKKDNVISWLKKRAVSGATEGSESGTPKAETNSTDNGYTSATPSLSSDLDAKAIKIMDYGSDKIAIIGNTYKARTEIKAMSGNYEPGVQIGGGKRVPGWLLPMSKKNEMIVWAQEKNKANGVGNATVIHIPSTAVTIMKEDPAPPVDPNAPDSIRIVDYTEKAIAVVGETRPVKDDLKKMGGKFNLKLKVGGAVVPGWIFPTAKRGEVAAWLDEMLEGEHGAGAGLKRFISGGSSSGGGKRVKQ
ncbi:hypothetical protein HDU76_004772 [Blyttiomyces sp. JEL0837]|nr:hypothetical protein HDU76_004772 [Blyttiomyces sp. JEL0837]